jgi:hypothetical protein
MRPACDAERFAARFGDGANDHLRYGRHFPSFLVAEVGEAKARARVEDRMLRHKAIEAALGCFRQRVIGRPLVGKFRMPADRRNQPRIQQRRTRRQLFKRTIGVPQPVP